MSERVLVIQTAFIGDAILTLPMIQELKKQDSISIIDVVCNPASAEIFGSSPAVENFIVLDKKNKHKSLFSLLHFAKELRKNNYAKVYSPHRSFRTALIVLMLGVRESFGFDNSSLKYVYRNLIKHDLKMHEVQRDLSLIGFSEKDQSWKILPELKFSQSVVQKVKAFVDSNGLTKFIAVAPGSVWATKRYPQEGFVEIIRHFVSRSKNIVLIGGREDKELCAKLSAMFPNNVIDASGQFSIVESIALMRDCELLISNDSAPTHFGMCVDIPILTIYCSTVPQFGFYPYNEKSRIIEVIDLECKPCGIHGYQECPIGTFECGISLAPQQIIKEAEDILN